jgi:diketogulonate reductase-like aldo/keto reductase
MTKIPRVGLGTGNLWKKERREAALFLREAFDKGLRFIDTAPAYGDGISETIIGEALKWVKPRREDYFIATKLDAHDMEGTKVRLALEASLKRLQTDYIDLYQIHWPSATIPIAETLFPIIDAYREGLVKNIGVCNFSLEKHRKANQILKSVGCPELFSTQLEYNLNNRLVEESVFPFCEAYHTNFIAYSPFDGGAFFKTLHPQLKSIAVDYYGVEVSDVVLAWLLRNPIVSVIPETHNMERLLSNLFCETFELSKEDCDEISKEYSSNVVSISASKIKVVLDGRDNRKVYTTVKEALENRLNLSPSPKELSKEILDGEILKPVKVRKAASGDTYELIEGRLRYWAYVIAFRDICMVPSIIVEN